MNLDPPPILEHLFLESPWAVTGVLLAGALTVVLISRLRLNKIKGLCVLAMLGLAVGVFVLAKAVTTDRERLILNTRQLVSATGPLDPAELDRLIDPRATVSGSDGTVWLNYDQVRPRLKRVVGKYGVRSQRVREVQAIAHDGGWGESTVIVRTEASGSSGIPINTGWHLTWEKTQTPQESSGGKSGGESGDGNWRVVDIRWMRFNGQEVTQGMLP
jgi:hypothetical protein